MPNQRIPNEAATLARLALITVPEDRLDALQLGLAGAEASARSIAAHHLGANEPAFRFRPPASR